jgi:uncharacterized LabA/DUF88 family protein
MTDAILMVDAGFLIQSLVIHAGQKDRSEVAVDYAAIAEALADLAEEETGTKLLRQIWYDPARDSRPRPEHRALAAVPGVQVQLGWSVRLNDGQIRQKAVDSLIVRDAMRAAYRDTVKTLVLVAGDGDLVPGFREASDFGLAIHLWGVASENRMFSQSEELIALADRRLTLELDDFSPFIKRRVQPDVEHAAEPAQPIGQGGLTTPVDGYLPETATAGPPQAAEATDSGAPDDDHVVSSAAPLAEPARIGPPLLRQLSSPSEYNSELHLDRLEELDATQSGARYGSRWIERADPEVISRLLKDSRRPQVPRRMDQDLMRYAKLRAVNVDEESERKAVRNGFWDSIEAHHEVVPAPLVTG